MITGTEHEDKTALVISRGRKNRNYTLKQVAQLTGLSVSYISDIEQGRAEPTVKTLKLLAEALGITFDITPGLIVYEGEWELIMAYRTGGYAEVLRYIASLVTK